MGRYIRLDENNKVVSVRYGSDIVQGEIENEHGEIGQTRLSDGSFVDSPAEPEDPGVSIVEQIYAENLYQTALLELQMIEGAM